MQRRPIQGQFDLDWHRVNKQHIQANRRMYISWPYNSFLVNLASKQVTETTSSHVALFGYSIRWKECAHQQADFF